MTTSPERAPLLLTAESLDVFYGQVQVLFSVDLEVRAGEIVALLGTNGAGKSTLLKAICGLVRPKRGQITFEGMPLRGPADSTARARVSLMPGGRGVFPTLTVKDNLRLAGWMRRRDQGFRGEEDRILGLFPALQRRLKTMAGNLSGGEQQMLALAQSLLTDPRLLMIDELSLGLAPTVVGELLDTVLRIHEDGVTIIVVEQSVNVALTLAERAVFMEKGQVRFTGPTQDLLDRPDLLRSVFLEGAAQTGLAETEPVGQPTPPNGSGSSHGGTGSNGSTGRERDVEATVEIPTVAGAPIRPPAPVAAPILECRAVEKRFGGIQAVDAVDLTVREGQIVGLIGQNGAGKTTLLDCISGFHDVDSGRIVFRAHDITDWAPYQRAKSRLGRSFQEAMLFPSLTVEETISVATERHAQNRSMLADALRLPASYESEIANETRVDELIDLTGLGQFREKSTGELSTGTRRIVELACILAHDPVLLLLDEPSAGVAQRETEALGPLLLRIRDRMGCSMLVIEHDMPLLSSISDVMVALELGRVIASGPPPSVLSDPRVIESYLGTNEAAINRSDAPAPAP